MNSPLSPALQTIRDQAAARNAAHLARLTRKSAPVVLGGTTRRAEPEFRLSGQTQPAFGKLAIDNLTQDEAVSASNKSGRAGLKAYMALWDRSL